MKNYKILLSVDPETDQVQKIDVSNCPWLNPKLALSHARAALTDGCLLIMRL